MARGPVKIERYNSSWPIMFEKLKLQLIKAMGDLINEIEHIGSTSIEGLGAKPTIDIAITVEDVDSDKIREIMEELEYQYLAESEDEFPFRRFYIKTDQNGKHIAHVHIVPIGHEFFKNHLLFRDYLLRHRDIRDEYHFLKTRLATKYRKDRDGYQKGKSEFIQRVTENAREELV